MKFRHCKDDDYNAVCDFLIALNQNDNTHINWNWARFEWMAEHPEFDKSLRSSIGLWCEGGRIVGAAIYDMYFGEAFCGALPGYNALFPEILDYAYRELQDDSGLGIALCDANQQEIAMAEKAGFTAADQTETVMSITSEKPFTVNLPDGLSIVTLDPVKEPRDFQWLLWQGFDHGTDKDEFMRMETIIPQNRVHFDPALSLAAVDADGSKTAYCCLWFHPETDYAYVEPVCTIPSYRGKGIAKALLYEALNRAAERGAGKAYVISDTDYYQKLGFKKEQHFTFYWKQGEK